MESLPNYGVANTVIRAKNFRSDATARFHLPEKELKELRKRIYIKNMPNLIRDIMNAVQVQGFRIEEPNDEDYSESCSRYFHIGNERQKFFCLRISDHPTRRDRCSTSVLVRSNHKDGSIWLVNETTRETMTIDDIVESIRRAASQPKSGAEWEDYS